MAAEGVTVNSVQPGLHETPRIEQLYTPDELSGMRIGRAQDFGAIVAFLCGDQARFTTGVQLHVDGGSYLGLM